jgi:leucine-rich repeat protein SHOC2
MAKSNHLDCLKELEAWNNNEIARDRYISYTTKGDEIYFLDLYSCKLKYLPPEFHLLTDLTKLHLPHNKIEVVPSEIFLLFNLTELYLGWNKIEAVPPELYLLANLKELYLNDNKIKDLNIPSEMGISNLGRLTIGRNQIEFIPSSICTLTNLFQFDIHDNRIDYIPLEMGALSKLKYLNLNGNNLGDDIPNIKMLQQEYNLRCKRRQIKACASHPI